MADYYELLGVPRTASGEEIKRAYRRKARELHPDANPDDTATAERFKEMARAYQVLSDPDQRARYDRFGDAGVGAGAGPRMEDVFGGGGLNDIFDAFFGGQSPFGGGGRRGPSGPPRGQDLEVVADISFEQAVFGATVPVTLRLPQRCEECGGSGAGAGTRPVTCADCNGSGQVQRVRQSLLGQMVTSAPCPRCGGLGQVVVTPCARCRGEGRVTAEHTYQVDVPAGVDSGSTLRLSARGAAGPRGGSAGDLYVHLRVAAARALSPGRQRPRHGCPDLDRPSGAGHDRRAADARRRRGADRPGRYPARSRVHPPQPRRAPAAGAWARRPPGPARRRSADEARRRRGRSPAPAGREAWRGRQPSGQGPVLADQVGVLVGRRWTRCCVAPRPTCWSPTSPRRWPTTRRPTTCGACSACATARWSR